LYWYLSGASVPPLITTSPAGTSRADAGVLGLPTTSILVGLEEFGDEGLSGGRIELGRWFPDRGGWGVHLAFLGLQDAGDSFQSSGSEIPILARPFYSIEPASVGPNAELVAFPGELQGNVLVEAASSFESAELMWHWMVDRRHDRVIQLVAGYQYNGLDDDLLVADFKRVVGGSSGLAIGTTLSENDQFQTENSFHGIALGLLGSLRNCRATVDLGMRLALGNSRSNVHINGSTTASVPVPGGPNEVTTTAGGLLTQATNLGSYQSDSFAVAPELHFGLGYDLSHNSRLLLGYRFFYWSQVARAAEQIDLGVNLSQLDPGGLVGEPRPRFDLRLADFWAQGLSLGIDYRY
jgi:hypothetical protein